MQKKWFQCWPEDMPKSLTYPEVPVYEILKGSAHRFKDKTALIFRDEQFSYNQFYEEALRFANALRASGFKKGDVIAIHMPNCPQYVVAYYGILLNGSVFSPVNPLLPEQQLLYQLNDCGAKGVVTSESAAEHIEVVFTKTELKLVIVTSDKGTNNVQTTTIENHSPHSVSYEDFLNRGEAKELNIAINPKTDLAHIAYTGGTTGRPKGVMLSHYNVVVNTIQFSCWGNGHIPQATSEGLMIEPVSVTNKEAERYITKIGQNSQISLTPWFHAMGTIGYLNIPLLNGTQMILHQSFDPALYLADVEKYAVASIGGAPPMFVALLQHPDFWKRNLANVKSISSGAAPLPIEVIESLKQRLPHATINEAYGLTEVTMGVFSQPPYSMSPPKEGTVGIPVFDTDVKIIPLDEHGAEASLPPNVAGEICLRGPQVMRGYYNQPEETALVLQNGWLKTGDIGFLDEEGRLAIVDRKKDMLIYNGYNVYPRELEELLFNHPAVANATVIGLPDREKGEIPKAFVVLKSDASISEAELTEEINEQVVHYKQIRQLEFVDDIPVSPAGKVLKRLLVENERKARS